MRPNGLTVLIGGARSGKSDLAVRLGRSWEGPVIVIATAEPFDGDLAERIKRHRLDRPAWPTIEAPIELSEALERVPADALVIVDCITVWVSNLLRSPQLPDDIVTTAQGIAAGLVNRAAPSVVVTNEVGLGVHPATELGREYRDLLGRVNHAFVTRANRALLLVAGRAVSLLDPLEGFL